MTSRSAATRDVLRTGLGELVRRGEESGSFAAMRIAVGWNANAVMLDTEEHHTKVNARVSTSDELFLILDNPPTTRREQASDVSVPDLDPPSGRGRELPVLWPWALGPGPRAQGVRG